LEHKHPLLIVFHIQLDNPVKPITSMYGTNKLYQHNLDTISKTINVFKHHVNHFMHDLDSSLSMRYMSETFTHRTEQVKKFSEALQHYYTDILQDMMKLIIQDVKGNDELTYFPVGVETCIEVGEGDCSMHHHLTFQCKIKSDFRQDGTPAFGYIELE